MLIERVGKGESCFPFFYFLLSPAVMFPFGFDENVGRTSSGVSFHSEKPGHRKVWASHRQLVMVYSRFISMNVNLVRSREQFTDN